MDKTLHAIYDDVRMAQQAIQQLIAIGIEQHAIQLISASSSSGIERDHIGGYADGEEHLHHVARDRVGSFASVEPARKPARNVSDTLKAAGVSPAEADSYATRVDAGAAVLFVQVDSDQFAQVGEILRVA